jgi:hypothetical protein
MNHVKAAFQTDAAASAATKSLERIGITPVDITPSRPVTEDPIAAEYPGQSYENQPGQGASAEAGSPMADSGPDPKERASAHRGTLARSGVRVLSIDVHSDDQTRDVEDILLSCGGKLMT